MTNVHRLFNNTPEQRAIDCLMRIRNGQADVRSGWLGYGAALNEIKTQYPGKQGERAFGEAVKAAGLDRWPSDGMSPNLGDIAIKADVRTAAMWAASLTTAELAAYMTKHPNTEVTARGGFRGLHAAVMAESKTSNTQRPKPKQEKARKVAAAAFSGADDVSVSKIAEDNGITRATMRYAAEYQRGRNEGLKEGYEKAKAEGYIDTSSLSMTAQQKLEAAKRHALSEMKKEFSRIVDAKVEKFIQENIIPVWQSKIAHAEEVASRKRGVMTKREYNIILSCLHPDALSGLTTEKMSAAFNLFKSKHIEFLSGEETAPAAPPLPNTLEEILAMAKARRPA